MRRKYVGGLDQSERLNEWLRKRILKRCESRMDRAREALRALSEELEEQAERERARLGRISSSGAGPRGAKAEDSRGAKVEPAATWADLDAALAALRFSSCNSACRGDKRSVKAPTRLAMRVKKASPTLKLPEQIIHCARQAKRSSVDDRSTRLDITHKYLTLWRDLAQTTTVVRNLSRRAVSHHSDTLVRHAFHAWQLYHARFQQLSVKEQRVAARAHAIMIEHVYHRWCRAFQYRRRYRRLQQLRQQNLLTEVFQLWQDRARVSSKLRRLRGRSRFQLARSAFHRWFQFIDRRHSCRVQYSIANQFFLEWCWKVFVKNVRRQVQCRHIAAGHAKSLQLRRIEILFDKWIVFVNKRKRWRAAIKWDRQCVLASALENWRKKIRQRRFVSAIIKRVKKKQRRSLLRWSFHQWHLAFKILRSRAVRFQILVERIALRRAFRFLRLLCKTLGEREVSMRAWKQRRAIINWHQQVQYQRSLTRRSDTVTRRYREFVQQCHGWRPWRLAYNKSIKFRSICARRRQREQVMAWKAFQAGVHSAKHYRSQLVAVTAAISYLRLKSAVAAWEDYTYEAHISNRQLEQAVMHHNRVLLTKYRFAWKQWNTRKQQLYAKTAIAHRFFATRLLRHWRAQATFIQKQHLLALARATHFWAMSCKGRSFRLWLAHTRQQHLRSYRLAFTAWNHAVQRKKACRAFFEIGRTLSISRQWIKWTNTVESSTRLRQIARQVMILRRRHVKYTYFVEKWLFKARNCRQARLQIESLGRIVAYEQIMKKWKHWKADRVKEKRARELQTNKLLTRYLKLFRKMTIERVNEAERFYQRHQAAKVWRSWFTLLERRKRLVVADNHYRDFRFTRGIAFLRANWTRSQTLRALTQRAKLWHTVVVLQTSMNEWYIATQRSIRLRAAHDDLRRSYLGTRYLRMWRFSYAMRLRSRVAVEHHDLIVGKKAFNAWRQITKRRLVAVAMWRYTTTRIRLNQTLMSWKTLHNVQRRVRLAVTEQRDKVQARFLRIVLSKWKLIADVESFRLILVEQRANQWAKTCWSRWRIYVIVERHRHNYRLAMVCDAFDRLRRHATVQLAGQHLRRRSVIAAASRALRLWRTECRVMRAHRSIDRTLLSYALHEWVRYTAGCRQQRKWIRYVQQLHRLHEPEIDEEITLKPPNDLDVITTSEDDGVRYDVLREALNGWHLLTKNSQSRRRRKYDGHVSGQPRSRISYTKQVKGICRSTKRRNDLKLALRFWSDRLVVKVFQGWKDMRRNSKLQNQQHQISSCHTSRRELLEFGASDISPVTCIHQLRRSPEALKRTKRCRF